MATLPLAGNCQSIGASSKPISPVLGAVWNSFIMKTTNTELWSHLKVADNSRWLSKWLCSMLKTSVCFRVFNVHIDGKSDLENQ